MMNLVLLFLLASGETTPSAEIEGGQAWSPLSVNLLSAEHQGKTSLDFLVQRSVLGLAAEPTAITRAQLEDEHPYGEARERAVCLARYEELRIVTPDGSEISVTITLAFDEAGKQLLCAYTDPAARWPASRAGLNGIYSAALKGNKFGPAHYDALQASVADVLKGLWSTFHVDPEKAGQIVIRPRFLTRDRPMRSVVDTENPWKTAGTGPVVPEFLPSNIWIVEVLGTVVFRRGEVTYTSLVAEFHDEKRQMLLGQPLP